VIVDNLHIVSIGAAPGEANPPLIVDADAVLAAAIAAKRFQAIARRAAQIVKRGRRVKHFKLAARRSQNVRPPLADAPTFKQSLCATIGEVADHSSNHSAWR
jgi:hypothetical protein